MTLTEHFHGPALLGVLCLLILVEECGVPIPLAPGDLILAICGLAIREGSLNPFLAIAAVYLVTIVGAMTGRELFDLAGVRLLRRFAGSGRLRGALDRASRLLARGGWPAVMVARLTPGLRIHTTQVAGLLGLPRRTFLLGLLPGAAVYVAVFVGIGMLLGPAAVRAVVHATHRVGMWAVLLGLVLVWVGAIWLVGHVLRVRGPEAERGGG